MPLVLIMIALLVLGLGLVQAWTIWFLKREVQRLEFRVNESLDDEDLLEFQERLQALLVQAKKASDELAQTVDKRKASLDKSLELAKQAEKSLALRILARTAAESAKPAPQPAKPKQAPAKGEAQGKAAAPAKSAGQPKAPSLKPPIPAPKQVKAVDKTAKPRKSPPGPSDGAFGGEDEDEDQGRPAAFAKDADAEARRSYLVRPASPVPARHQKIYDLADQGLGLEQIARQSGVLAGEVDLILNLRRKEPPNA